MRVTKRDISAAPRPNAASPLSKPNLVLQVGLLVLSLALGFVIHQQGWHRPLVDFIVSFIQRPAFTATALFQRRDVSTLPALNVALRFEDYQRLLDARSRALRLGVNVASAQDDVRASIDYAGAAVDVQMRLAEGPARALSSNTAWPFEVVVQDGETLFGLRRFSLTPAGAPTLSTWGYLETLRRADLLSPRYHLVRLILNGTDTGLYALEERPTAESPSVSARPGGVVAYFDQHAYWEARARLGDALPGSGFQYAQLVADCAPSTPDAVCGAAIRQLRALQSGERVPSDVWDVDRIGAFLALTTLWRGAPDTDWRSVHLARTDAAQFELVGVGHSLTPVAHLPDIFTDDALIQTAYVRALEEFSSPDYLAQLQADLDADLRALQLALWADMGYLELPWPALEAHQTTMRHQLSPSRTLWAYVEADETALMLRMGNIQPFPVEIVGLDVGETVFLTVDKTWVVEADRASLVDVPAAVVLRAAAASRPRYIQLQVPPEALPAGHDWVWQTPGQIRIVTRLWGSTGQNIVDTTIEREQ